MNAAAFSRQDKEQNPGNYCHDPKCLWRIVTARGANPCQKHPVKPVVAQPTMTRAEWNAKHSDFKCVMDGRPMVLRCNPKNGGAELAPVTIIENR